MSTSNLLLEKKRLNLLKKTRRLKFYQELLEHAEFLIEYLAADMKLSQKAILNKGRKRNIVIARAIIYRVLYETSYSLEDIAYVFNKHHGSVMYGLKILQKEMDAKKNKKIKDHYRNLRTRNLKYIEETLDCNLKNLELDGKNFYDRYED